MNDAVDRVIAEREALDRGLSSGFLASVTVHLLVLVAAIVGPLLRPRKPLIQVADGFSVPLPPGGGGLPKPPETAAPGPPQPAPQPQPNVEPPPKVIKPPKEEKRKGLPELDAKKVKKRPEKAQAAPASGLGQRSPGASAAGGAIGIGIGPPGPGGTDMFGDWYLAGVQQKIWIIWTQQMKTGFTTEIKVSFVILADGSVADVSVTQPSGVTLLDLAAQRAVTSAGPFGPLPKSYGTNRYPIQALFKPTP